MLYDLEAVKANIRNREGKRVFFLAKGDQMTSEGRDFLNRERIEIRPGESAAIREYRLLNGGVMTEKPEYMTHLCGDILVSKNHPRIAFRGAVDTLEAEILLCQEASPHLHGPLQEILELTRKLIRWEVMEEKAEETLLCGMTPEELRKRSHFPQNFYGQPHFMPAVSDGLTVLRLNRARCAARHAELCGVAAFVNAEGQTTRGDLLQVLNRLSSILYILMIQEKAKR